MIVGGQSSIIGRKRGCTDRSSPARLFDWGQAAETSKAFALVGRITMQGRNTLLTLLGVLGLLAVGQRARTQEKPAPGTIQVHVVITDEALQPDKELPPLQREDVKVKQGKNFLKVTQLIPAEEANAAL
jgi:hypothetical protein